MDFFEENKKDCPCHDYDECTFQVHYNGHVNDPQMQKCFEEGCPVYYWIEKLMERVPVKTDG